MTERELMILRRALPTDVWCELYNESKKEMLNNRREQGANSNLITIDKRQLQAELEKVVSDIVKNIRL